MSTQPHTPTQHTPPPAAPKPGNGKPKGPTQQAAATPPTGGIPAYGTLIQVFSGTDTGGADVYTTIAGMGDVTGPSNTMAEVDVTSHSTGVPIKQTIPGLIDLGDLAFPCFWIPGDPTQSPTSSYGIEYLFINRIVTKWQLIAPDPTHYTRQFKGFVKTMGEDYKVAGVMTRNIAIRITTPLVAVASPISLTPPSDTSVPNTGAPTGTIQVAAGGSMAPWTAVPSDSWITITSPTAPQQGDGTITYAVANNPTTGTPRSGTINVTGLNLVFDITQLG
jgi:hypothetical protein